MPKKIEDIIVPERKRSIRDIPIPEGRRKNNGYEAPSAIPEPYPPEIGRRGSNASGLNFTLPRRGRKGVWIASGVALLVLVFPILSLFNAATLAYVPKSAAVSFGKDIYTAHKAGEGKLLYSVIKLSKEKSLEALVAAEEQVSRKASGTIVVYNNVSTEPQRLVENTRFETPDGLVYRMPKAIVIPGIKTVSGIKEPGRVETVVYADEAGAKYNIGLSDFTLPGLAGTSRFTTIYARSKTGMSGGFVGTEKVVNSQDQTRIKTQLETTLRDELISEARAQLPEGFILYPSLSSVTFDDLPQTATAGSNNATLNMRGNLYGVMFKKNDLSDYLARDKIALTASESVDIMGLDSLNLVPASALPVDLVSSDEIKFAITGETVTVWRTDEVALKTDLLGRHKRDIPSILNNYPTVVSATATIRPFWKRSFPSSGAKVSIKQLPVN